MSPAAEQAWGMVKALIVAWWRAVREADRQQRLERGGIKRLKSGRASRVQVP